MLSCHCQQLFDLVSTLLQAGVEERETQNHREREQTNYKHSFDELHMFDNSFYPQILITDAEIAYLYCIIICCVHNCAESNLS